MRDKTPYRANMCECLVARSATVFETVYVHAFWCYVIWCSIVLFRTILSGGLVLLFVIWC